VKRFIATFFVLAWPEAVFAQTCPKPPTAPKLSVALTDVPTAYNNERDVYAMRDSVRLGYVVAGQHESLLGVTASKFNYGLNTNAWVVRLASGTHCVALGDVKVSVGFEAMDVFIAQEYPPGSCEYNAIRDHENQHVATNRATVKEFLPKIRREFEIQLKTMGTRTSRNAQGGVDAALTELSRKSQPVFEDLQRLLAHRHAQIDSAESYAAVQARCTNWRNSGP